MQHHGHLLALAHLGELRFGETGVHQHHSGAELAASGHGDDETAVVAAQHTDDRARGDTELLQAVRQCPRLVIDLLVRQRPTLVDDRRQGRVLATTLDRHRGLRTVDACELGGLNARTKVLQVDDSGVDESPDRAPRLGYLLQLLPNAGQHISHRPSSPRHLRCTVAVTSECRIWTLALGYSSSGSGWRVRSSRPGRRSVRPHPGRTDRRRTR